MATTSTVVNVNNGATSTNQPQLATLGYWLYGLGILFGITAIIGMVISHTRIASVAGSHQHRHLLVQLGSFWLVATLTATCLWLWPASEWRVVAGAAGLIWLATWSVGGWLLYRQQRAS